MPKYIVKAKEYKVQDGDTVESIAKAGGITPSQLAKFNWNTEDPTAINLALRDKVGARKKADDNKTFILTKDDEPGIIYIPETTSPKSFAPNTTHNIELKSAVRVYKTADSSVRFRPKEGWKGESYGFDWFREADYKVSGLYDTLDFNKKIFGKLYIPKGAAEAAQKLQTDGNSYTGDFRADPDMLKKAKKDEYMLSVLKNAAGKDIETFAAHINIYINELELKPPQTVELQAIVNNKNEVLDELIFEMKDADKDFIVISTTASLKKIPVKDDIKMPLKLECLKPITAKIEVLAKGITRNSDGSYLERPLGKLIVHPNEKAKRKHVKILLIEVKTPALAVGGTASTPDMTNQDQLFTKLLRQALVNPVITKPNIVLDVTTDVDFTKNFTKTEAGKTRILAYKWKGKGYEKMGGTYSNIQSYLDVKLKAQLVKAKSPLASKLDNYIKAYYFGEDGMSDVDGSTSNLNGYSTGKYVVMFKSRNEGTSPHEFLHSLGLPHTFDTGADTTDDVSKNAKFSYKYAETDNIMDYSHHRSGYENSRVATFRWQWAIVNSHKLTQPNDE